MAKRTTKAAAKDKKAGFSWNPHTYLQRKMLTYWKNMCMNYDEPMSRDSLFDPIEASLPQEKVAVLIKAQIDPDKLEPLMNRRGRCGRLDFDDTTSEMLHSLWNNQPTRKQCRKLCETLADMAIEQLEKDGNGEKEAMEGRFEKIQRLLKLTDIEMDIMTFCYVRCCTCFELPERAPVSELPQFVAMATDRPTGEVEKAMGPEGKLRRFTVLDEDWDFNRRVYGAFLDGTGGDVLERRFYRKADMGDVLPWEYYGELAEEHGEILKRMLKSSDGRLNVLLYGEPGTGKTSFAKTLAKETGRTLYEVRHGDEDGRNMGVGARMAGLKICNEQVDGMENMVMVDEADELLRNNAGGRGGMFFMFGGPTRTVDKGIVNSLLDDTRAPTFWLSNSDPETIDESVRRRFDYSIRFDKLNKAQREAIWANGVKRFGLGKIIGKGMIPGLALKYPTSAGGISTVLRNVSQLKPKAAETERVIEKLMKQHCQLMGNSRLMKKGRLTRDYTLKGLNIKGKVGTERMLKAIENFVHGKYRCESGTDSPRMNLLMWGPPGCGKTEFVKYVGEQTGMRVIECKGSDILNQYVGGTEQNIAATFREADGNSILFMDEVDGLLHNRAGAQRSWEVSQVNELLQQMEQFEGIFIAATNFKENLDPAVMRRFTFKIEFDYLENEGKAHFFEHMFRRKLTEAERRELDAIPRLCPGDFRTVRQSLFYLDGETTNADYLEGLRLEADAKQKSQKEVRIGFD